MRSETRFRTIEQSDPERFAQLAIAARENTARRVANYEQMAHITLPKPSAGAIA